MMDVAADHAVDVMAPRLAAQRLLELADKVDGVLDFELDPSRQRPVRQAEQAAEAVEMRVQHDRQVVGMVAEQGEPAGMADHHVEQIAMDDEIAAAVSRNMND